MNGNPLWKILRGTLRFVGATLIVLAILWAAGAVLYDLPGPPWLGMAASLVWLISALAAWFVVRARLLARVAVVLGFTGIFVWWLTVQPKQSRDWKPEVAVLARAEIVGDKLTIHDVRNFDHHSKDSFTPHYETRTYDLTKVKGVDIFLAKWGSGLMGHPVVSFDFGEDVRLAFTIEIRPEKGESFDPLGAIFRKFELIYIPADERDVIRSRTAFRAGEKVYLYRMRTTPGSARTLLEQYITRLNQLHERPEWYNIATANCTTSIRAQNPQGQRIPWDWRILLNGNVDELLYERGALNSDDLSFSALRESAQIRDTPPSTGPDTDFSRRIREERPGFTSTSRTEAP
jgi:hypothetical protein